MQTFVLISLALVSLCARAQTDARPSRVHQMFVADQAENPGNITEAEHNRKGDARRAELRTMLDKGEIKIAQDFADAAILFQHGEVADDYLLAHVLAMEAVIRGDPSAKWVAAATLDRYLMIVGKSQVFGTQYPADPEAAKSPARPLVDARVSNVVRTQSPFDQKLLPDYVRVDFCVPDRAQQVKNLAIFNTGNRPDTMRAVGCK